MPTDAISIRFECHNCGKILKIDPKGAGRKLLCPKCKTQLIVPPIHIETAEVSEAKSDQHDFARNADLEFTQRADSPLKSDGAEYSEDEMKWYQLQLRRTSEIRDIVRDVGDGIVQNTRDVKSEIRSARRGIGLLLVFLFIGFLAYSWFPTRWEYMIVAPRDEMFEMEMNTAGAAGWELVSARRATSIRDAEKASYEVILRRHKTLFNIR